MPENETHGEHDATTQDAEAGSTPVRRVRKRATKATAEPVGDPADPAGDDAAPVKATRRRATRKTASAPVPDELGDSGEEAPAPRTRRRRAVAAEEGGATAEPGASAEAAAAEDAEVSAETEQPSGRRRRAAAPIASVLFMPPADTPVVAPAPARAAAPARVAAAAEEPEPEAPAADDQSAEGSTRSRRRRGRRTSEEVEAEAPAEAEVDADLDDDEDDDDSPNGRRRRRRGRRGRGRGRGANGEELEEGAEAEGDAEDEPEEEAEAEADADGLTRRRTRRRRRRGAGDAEVADEPHVVVKIREPRSRDRDRDEVQGVSGSTRLEAKRQRRRDGREQRRTRPPILSESEFLARREAVDRVMVIRQKNDRTQIAVLEDNVLVEHYVTRQAAATMVGNVYLGRVQNVLPSMEAAFIDIGRGRNAVLYAGEVNWDATGLEGRTRTIEQALKSGDSVLVQVTKDPIGTKGARLTSHIALSGRHLVFVPNGNASGISRKLSDVERKRLRDVLKNMVPDGAGVIVRTAAEGASEDDLARDVKRLQAQWEEIQVRAGEGHAPTLLYEEPDLIIRVVRDLFNEDFRELIVQGSNAYEMVEPYLTHVSPDLVDRLRRHAGPNDVFAEMRIDEQLIKALDRRVFLPSGGSLVIDRTEAMTVVDVNTGKYTGAGGNLEETVTRNNIEAAEEIVRQLRLRDLGGIIVIDFIDMVLESNRELVLRRLTECLGRDRTKHQVTEITSLGLVQMTRKRVGQGLLEAFSETCEVCKGRGLIIHTEPVPEKRGGGGGDRAAVAKVAAASNGNGSSQGADDEPAPRSSRRRGRRGGAAAVELDDAVDAPLDAPEVDDEVDSVVADDVTDVEPLDPADIDGDEPTGNGRRRTRRGGVRRRTRP